MKRNLFGEVIAQPGDDPYELLSEYFGILPIDGQVFARFVEFDEVAGWSCEIEDGETAETMQVHDFESEQQLRDWLAQHNIDEI